MRLWIKSWTVTIQIVDYEQSLFFSWSVEQNARDTQMTTRATEGARRERPLPRSRTRALPLLKLKKKSLLAVYSNWSYWAVLSCDTIYYAVQCGSNLCVCG